MLMSTNVEPTESDKIYVIEYGGGDIFVFDNRKELDEFFDELNIFTESSTREDYMIIEGREVN